MLACWDPNWSADAGGGGKGANAKYALDDVDAIAHYMRSAPPWSDAGPGLMFLWATVSALNNGDAHALVRRLGFRVCANFVWVKVDVVLYCEFCSTTLSHHRAPLFPEKCRVCTLPMTEMYTPPQVGMGQWGRMEHEHLLVCRRRHVDLPDTESRHRSVIYAPRGEHSEKPTRAWTQVIGPISRAVMPGVVGYEGNARSRRHGWSAWGRLDGEDMPLRFEECPQEERTAP